MEPCHLRKPTPHDPTPAPPCSPISRVFKVVWAAWRAPKQAAATDGSEPLLLSHTSSGALESSLPTGVNGSGSLHGGLADGLSSSSAAAAAMGGTGGVGGGMGRRTQSLQWLNAAAEVRVAGGRPGCLWVGGGGVERWRDRRPG